MKREIDAPLESEAKKTITTNTIAEQEAVNEVAKHYNNRPELGVQKRNESVISNLRYFNNWIKSILIGKYVRREASVLDMGCGKGGDLLKYGKRYIRIYVGADIAAVSIDQAKERYNGMRDKNFQAKFIVHDCYGKIIKDHLPKDFIADAVSLQFCMHYAFESEEKVRIMLQNVSDNLKSGGYFFATIPNSNWIVKKLRASDGLEFGNSVYKIKFEDKKNFPIFGHKYWFLLQDAIDDCPEFLVHFPTFEKIAKEYKLKLILKENFHEMYSIFSKEPHFNELLYKMKVINQDNPNFKFDSDQWEAVGIYLACVFEKI